MQVTKRNWTSTILGAVATSAAILASGTAVDAASGSVSATYAMTLGAFTLGVANAESQFDDEGYSVSLDGHVTGIARIFSNAHAELSSSGRFTGSTVQPMHFFLDSWEGDFYAGVRMELRSGAVTSMSIDPPAGDHPDLIPITSRHRRNIVDPLSAFMAPIADENLNPLTVCTRTVPIFDGWQRFDLELYYKTTRTVQSFAYTGPVFVCGARYQPIAGHRPDDDTVQRLLENDTLEIWLAPMGSGVPYLVPYFLGLDTQLGRLSIRASRLVFSAGPPPAAQ
jgi:hypothetical protein